MARDEVAVALCHDWMLEFVCHDMWEKFKSGCDIDQGLFDLSNGVILAQKFRSNESMKSREVVFLMLTSSLMSLKKTLTGGVSVLQIDFQNILRMVADLSALCDSDSEAVTEKTAEAYMKTVLQRIVECCRQDCYDMAETLFNEDSGQLDKETSRKVQAILHAKSKPHRFLDEFTLESYLSAMTKYLDAVHHTFPDQPIMLQHAKHYLAKTAEYNGVSREIDKGEGDLTGKEERILHKKLQVIRKRKLKAAALSGELENNNNSATEDDAADGTPDNSSHSGSPRKKQATRGEVGREPSVSPTCSVSSPLKSPLHQHRRRAGGSRSKSTERGGSRSEHANSVSDESIREEDSDSEGRDGCETSLHSRMPTKMKTFSMRRSLEKDFEKPPPRRMKSRLRRKWTEREEEEFYLAVQELGVGEWQYIKQKLKTDRSNVQLKDKWRNILATSYKQLSKKYGPVRVPDGL
ncbi:uncharacterized protein LOC143293846 isoform X2 [Babylonia areolata]|uniref:uncharacterized protein LOC143293846 isoform X2 n=1 Tax=Babylonia areolata TaxID=304850 RepID=UPI003FD4D48B